MQSAPAPLSAQASDLPTSLKAAAPTRFRYQRQDSTLTIREGLDEYMQSFPELLTADEMDAETAAFFRRHDTCHVVFGLNTTLRQETMADIVTLFGVDIAFRRYVSYLKLDAARGLLQSISKWKLISEGVLAIPSMFRAYRSARRMTKKFPWDGQEPLLDRPLAEVRAEYGIEVLGLPAKA